MNLPISHGQATDSVREQDSSFHPGEQAVQTWAGVRDKAEALGQRMLTTELVAAQRAFFAGLSFVIVARVDVDGLTAGQPWAELVTGSPGFIEIEDGGRVRLATAETALCSARPGTQIGLLGIDLARRRRNRINGTILASDGTGIMLKIDQGYGNCPKHITKRPWVAEVFAGDYAKAESSDVSDEVAALVDRTDTFFIASSSGPVADNSDIQAAAWGADISHRGGEPGFIARDGNRLSFSDYPGNNLFNTLGNLRHYPRCGLIILDFEQGDIVQIAGVAELTRELDDKPATGSRHEQFRIKIVVNEVRHWQKR